MGFVTNPKGPQMWTFFMALAQRKLSVGPTQRTAVADQQNQQPKADPIPRERGEIMRGDVAQQPAHAHKSADEGRREADREVAERVGGQQMPVFVELISGRAEDDRNREKKRKLGGNAPLEPEQHPADDRRARTRHARNQSERLREGGLQRIERAQ